MNRLDQCVAVIPCFNEAANIAEVVRSVYRHLPTVLVVDDGSTDNTAIHAKEADAEVIRLPRNSGKGAALRTGWRLAHERGFGWALTLDGDGQHHSDDIPTLLCSAGMTNAALVVGNRMGGEHLMPWLRRQVNRAMSYHLSQLAGLPLPDSQCGFRLMNLDAWSRLHLITRRFEIESEVLLAFIAAGHKVAFAPIQTIYKSPSSKIHPVLDTWRWFRWLAGRNHVSHERIEEANQAPFLACNTIRVPK